jgi:hypothetical protein
MSRSERRDYFERLCSMRDRYGASPDDRGGVLSIEDMILYAEAVMVALDEPAWDGAMIESIDEMPVPDLPAAFFASDGRLD